MYPSKGRILCVDDNEDNSSMLVVLLGLSSYEALSRRERGRSAPTG